MEVDLFQFSIPCFVPPVQLDGTSFTSSSNQTNLRIHHQSSAIFPDSPPIPPGLKNIFQELQQGSGAVLLRFPPGWLENVGEDVCERAFLGLCGLVMGCDRHFYRLYMKTITQLEVYHWVYPLVN
jgi:hypothetical protein